MDNEHLRDLHNIEQSSELFLNTWPPLLRSFFQKLVNEGFAESQAFDLTKVLLSDMMKLSKS